MLTMRRTRPAPFLVYITTTLLLSLSTQAVFAQRGRIPGRVNPEQWHQLSGNVHPNASTQFDQGKAPDSLPITSITLVLKPSAEQQAALDQLLADQQNPTSTSYHHWLTPEEYADRFGASQSDVAKIVDWAQSEELSVSSVARARNAILLKGSAAQVNSAFHTEIHLYQVNGKFHFANATNPSVPAAMQDVVQAVHGLHNFRLQPRAHRMIPLGVAADGVSPNYTSSGGNHYLAPDDFATIFDVSPLYNAGINGSGQSIAIVGQSQIVPSHLSTFSNYFGLPTVNLTATLVPNTQDPGIVEADEQESDLDLQWASAVARGVNLVFVYSYDVTDAVQYAIDQNLAPVISMSYGLCETSGTRSDAATMRTWAQQANAQGVTWVTASGDSGAAGCYQPGASGSSGLALSAGLPASIPEVTGVGGTTFSEGSGSYWSSSNSITKASALSYIPEVSWNDSAADGSPSATGGGASVFFAKPSWQTGTGVPNDGARDVPDVSFPASADHDGYLVYTSTNGRNSWFIFGGTSCAAPTFSGVLALLNQYVVANGYQSASGMGNVNTHLYSLAASAPSAFHDVTSGNNIVSATCTSPRCGGVSSTSGGYTAGTGYDLVTGLGSVDAYRLVSGWHSGNVPKSTPAIALAATPDSLTAGGTATLTATVASADGATPTGTVTFYAGSTNLGTATLSGIAGSATASLTIPGNAAGLNSNANTITAVYNGDSAHNAATTITTLIVVNSSAIAPTIGGLTDAASYRQSFAPGMVAALFGSSLALSTRSAPTVPVPTTLDNVSVTVNGVRAPLFYISPTQLNVQIPYETPSTGNVVVVVSNNGQTASTTIPISAAAPGIFADLNGGLAPSVTATRGQTMTLYFTGAGAVQPAAATGNIPVSGATPVPTGKTLVTVGGIAADTSYLGIPGWSVGIVQVNFTVPATVSLGTQQVVVSVGGLASKGVTLNVTN
jgi:uncharacterized protein (TIGR03437 family)